MRHKFLIIRPDHIGDLILTTPFIHAVKSAEPDSHLSILAGSWSLPVLKNNPYLDDIIECDLPWLARGEKKGWSPVLKTLLSLRFAGYDSAFSFRIAAKTAAFVFLSGIKKRWGFDVKKSRWAYNRNVHYSLNKHVVDNFLDIAEQCFGSKNHIGLELFLDEAEYKNAEKIIPCKRPYCVIAPGAGYTTKLWETGRWAEVADWIGKNLGLDIIISGSPKEKQYTETIRSEMRGKAANLTGKINLRHLMAVIDRAELVVSVDSAAMHIASAVKTPVAALFGPTNPVMWGPYPNGMDNRIIHKIVECQYCKVSNCEDLICMRAIEVKDVINAVKDIQLKNNHKL